MATKKSKKKKVIDGVIRDTKKKSKKIQISPKDTSIVVEADSIKTADTKASDALPAEGSNDIIVEEPAVEEEITEKIEEEPVIEIEVREETPIETKEEKDIEKPTEEYEPIDSITETTTEVEAPTEDNLNELIKDIEKNDKKESRKEASSKNSSKKDGKDKKPRKKLPARALPFRILSVILALSTIIAVVSAIVRITLTGIVPNKYLIPAIVGLALILLFYLFKALRRKTHIPVLIILNLIGIALGIVSVFGFVKVQETMNFLFDNFNESKEYTVYDIIVSNKSNYTSIDDVKGKTFHSISNFVDIEKLEAAAKDQANASIAYEDGISSLLKNTYNDTSYIAVLNAGTWDATLALNDGKNDYVDKYKVIGELKVEEEKKNETVESNLSTDSFTVFVSGIDTRSGVMLDRSLSDVNMVITVNPKTKNILMTTIPRDYYVQLHGATGLRDKLTHAGALGGIKLSMDTIEDLLDFEFSRYIRVNFNFVIDLVNAVGGISIYSDVNYNITAYTNRKCIFTPGNNTVDGTCALAFARERYAYADGDRHRGRNQEQVIEKVFEKLTSSTTFISKYSDILNSLNGSFDTNISANDITSLANMQLNDMAKWTVETYNLDGPTGMAYTYSYPNQLLSVMYPDEATVETARKKIKQILSGTPEAAPTETTETVISE